MGNTLVDGPWIDASGTSVARTTLVQFPSCAYNADGDAFLQGNMALPGALVGKALTVEVLKNATLASAVTVCVQAGTTYDTGFATKGYVATKTTRTSFQACVDDVAAGTVNAVYTGVSALTLVYNAAPSSYYAAPFPVVDAEYNAFPMFRFDSSVNAASSMMHVSTHTVAACIAFAAIAAALRF
jgi:ABC-type amino acid transport substrate-binding protein